MKDKKRSWFLWLKIVIVLVVGFIVFLGINITENISIVSIIETMGKVSEKIFTKENLWWMIKIVVFFFAFVFFCHKPLVWMGILFSIEDGKAKLIYARDRILTVKITYYRRILDDSGNVIEDKKSNLLKPLKWFKNYFFGSLHFLGIPGIHKVDNEIYEWEKLNPMTGKAEPAKGVKGEFPLREFIPAIGFENLDVVGGQINVRIGPLIKITNPIKTATIARDWFPFFVDMMRGHIREFFVPLDFFRVMINKKNFGTDKVVNAPSLSSGIMTYFRNKKVKDKIEDEEVEFSLLEFIERKYGIKILEFYIIDPDPADTSKDLLNAISKPEKAKLEAKELVITAGGKAEAFNKEREAMEKPGGELLRKLQALEKSRLVTLGDGKGLNLFVDADK